MLRRLLIFFLSVLVLSAAAWWWLSVFPGRSFSGPYPALDGNGQALMSRLASHLENMESLGERTPRRPRALFDTARWLESAWRDQGYTPSVQTYEAYDKTFQNIFVEAKGRSKPDEIILLGAHYDTVEDCPGADDNGTGVAALLELSRMLQARGGSPGRTVRFVAFTMEEYYFGTHHMGSAAYAKQARERNDNIVGMISLETMGYFADAPKSQKYPMALLDLIYPSQGNFITFVSDFSSRSLAADACRSFRSVATVPSEGISAPRWVPGIGLSDHLSFWHQGYPAIMVTDTAMFRNPHYHMPSDRVATLDLNRFTRVVQGLNQVVLDLSGP